MKAAVYSIASPSGVHVVELPRPTLHASPPRGFLEPKQLSTRLTALLLKLSWYIFSICISLFRKIVWFAPPTYGHNSKRQFVLCEVRAAAVNPVDAKWLYGDKIPMLLPLVQKFLEGRVCGIDFAGVVIEAPPGCGFTVGDEVFGTMPPAAGSFAEVVRCPSDFIHLKPENLSFQEASAVPLVGLTVTQAFGDIGLKPNMHVCVLGASGGTGHVAVQVAKHMGARVTAVCGKKNAAFVRGLGADTVVEYDGTTDVFMQLASVCTSHGAFNAVFDSVSSHDPRDMAFDYERRMRTAGNGNLLQADSMYIIIGGLFWDWVCAHVKRFLCIDLFPKDRMLFWVRFPNSSGYLAALKDMCEAGSLRVSVGQSFPLSTTGVQQAFALQMSRHAVGKIVIDTASSQQ